MRQASEADLVEQPLSFGGRRWSTVVRQGDPRRQRLLAGCDGVVVLRAELVSESALVLPLTTPCDDCVDMHRVDLTGEPIARGGVLCRA
jgi:alkylhydroperoxidase family enzyme